MKRTWKKQPTPAAQVITRAMEERGWKQQDVALQSGLDAPNVSRWVRGSVNPPDHRVAEVAASLGYDPRDFGITSPHALARAARHAPQLDASSDAPEWARRQHAELVEALSRIETILRTG